VMDGGEPGDSELDGGVNGGDEAGTAGESGVARQWMDGGEPGDGELDGGVNGGKKAGTALPANPTWLGSGEERGGVRISRPVLGVVLPH
jgi:hypothetical protein